ncbi:MAG TPA: VWA domain-containing protein [Anaerolineae bacterium]|nr:VWA domain-containing protein [Anaerolineae bacterium]
MTQTPTSNSHLLHNLLLFGRLLRGLGLDVNPGRTLDLVHALEHIDLGRKTDFYYAVRGLLVHQHEDFALFDEAFDLFWRKPTPDWTTLDLRGLGARQRPRRPLFTPPPLRKPRASAEDEPNDRARPDEPPIVQVTLTYSAQEVLRRKDFAELTAEELEAIKRLIAAQTWRLDARRTRRQQPGRGPLLDLRRTVRHSLKYGGEVLEWARREPKHKPRPLVIIADISGSMERYTRLLLHFIYGLTAGLDQPVEAFVFGTRLTRITRQLRLRDVDGALREVARAVPDWSGGTRIGDTLKTFNFVWGRRVLGRGAIVLLISDGWDRGDTELLKTEMARLQRSCHRLIWLNPLLGSPQYEPLTRGMQAALPYIDDFLPAHSLASLEDLAAHLAGLEARRNVRRQAGARVH